jgi:hypothetical protein
MATSRVGLRAAIPPPPMVSLPQAQDPTHPAPEPTLPTIIDVLNAPFNTTSSSGIWRIIHVQPDHRFPLISWIYSVSHTMQSTMYNRYPLASPASLIGYCLVMFTAMHYHCDAFLAPVPSPMALNILNDNLQSSIFSSLLDLPVPPFMVNELESIRPFISDLASNLAFFPTMASSNFALDFGRFIPANTFFTLHNLMASLPGNSSTASLLENFYKSTIANIAYGGLTIQLTPAHLFGHVMSLDNVAVRYQNWFNSRINMLVNALAIRPVNAQSIPGNLPLNFPAYANVDDFNPYLLGIGYADENEHSFVQIFHSLGQFTRDVFPSSKPLRTYTQLGTPEIARYLSSTAPFPTWHSNASGLTDETDQIDLFRPTHPMRTHKQFAEDTAFLNAPADPTADPTDDNRLFNMQQFPRPTDADFDSAQLVESTPPPAGTPDPTKFITRSSKTVGPTPDWIIFDPSSNTTTHLGAVIVSGKVIETGDIDSSVVVTEDVSTSLYQQNGMLISGCVPFSQVRNGLTGNDVFVLQRTPNNDSDFPIGFFRGNSFQLWLPVFRRGIVYSTAPGAHPTIEQLFPNFILKRHSRYATFGSNVCLSVFGGTYRHMPGSSVRMWSSYRTCSTSSRGAKTWYMIPSLRPTFGYIARVFSTIHPAHRIP